MIHGVALFAAALGAAPAGEATAAWVLEFDENKLRMQEDWQLTLSEPAPAGSLRFELPKGVTLPGIDVGQDRFVLDEADTVVTHPSVVPAGSYRLNFHYQLPTGGREAEVTWSPPPLRVPGVRVAHPALDGLQTNVGEPTGQRPVAGVRFLLYDVPRPFDDGSFTLRLSGLPTVITWHRTAAAVACAALAVFTLVVLMRPARAPVQAVDPYPVQKARLVTALKQLDAQPLPDPQVHRARRQELMDQLADVLRREARDGAG
jgi:hypothetical protein